jgi:hypothetical protein
MPGQLEHSPWVALDLKVERPGHPHDAGPFNGALSVEL